MHKSRRIIIPVIAIVVLAIAATALYFGQGNGARKGGLIEASGTVEADEISVASELSGRVVEVLVGKGEAVEAGQPLLRLDDELLQAQRERAERTLDAAQANHGNALSGLALAEANLKAAEVGLQVAEANAQAELIVAQQALDDLDQNAEVARMQAQQAVAAANRGVREATYQYDNFTVPSNQAKLTTMDAIDVTKGRLDGAREEFEPYRNEDSGDDTREDLLEKLEEAQADYDAAIKRLEYETAVSQAEARLAKALEDLEKVQDGPDPDQAAALEARIAAIQAAPDLARAAVEQARIGVEQAQTRLEQAEKAVAQSQAELDLVNVQLKKLVVYAWTAGIILSRDVEPGEVVQAGAAVMTLAQLAELTITVYISEDQYGQISLGDEALITVDSFPGKSFRGEVNYIAGKAEFTPRNVQTSEGRRTTVFAIEVAVENLGDELKPGMPADVCFGCR
jgi:multidrug resistance efflux pump